MTHETTRQPDGSVRCTCGAVSQRFGTNTRAQEWARDHKAEALREVR